MSVLISQHARAVFNNPSKAVALRNGPYLQITALAVGYQQHVACNRHVLRIYNCYRTQQQQR